MLTKFKTKSNRVKDSVSTARDPGSLRVFIVTWSNYGITEWGLLYKNLMSMIVQSCREKLQWPWREKGAPRKRKKIRDSNRKGSLWQWYVNNAKVTLECLNTIEWERLYPIIYNVRRPYKDKVLNKNQFQVSIIIEG